jgi:hypothetical protein
VPTVFADQSFVLQNSHKVEFPIDDTIWTKDFFFLHVWDYRDSRSNGLFDILLKAPAAGLGNHCPYRVEGAANLSRRGFLRGIVGSGASSWERTIYPRDSWGKKSVLARTQADLATLPPNLFVGIDTMGRSTSSRTAPRWAQRLAHPCP